MMLSLRFPMNQTLFSSPKGLHRFFSPPSSPRTPLSSSAKAPTTTTIIDQNGNGIDSPLNRLSEMEDVLMAYIFGKKKATEVAHLVWKQVLQKGNSAVDATCGNGHDTLAMLRMVVDESGRARVYGMDIQKEALRNTSCLLDLSLRPLERELVKVFDVCHSRMEEVVPEGAHVRLVAFNLGYLPGGDKSVITMPETTVLALQAAKTILVPGGLISIVVYVGHPGGRKEHEAIEAFASGLPVESWSCCKFQMLNRPLAPLLIFLFKR